MIGLCEMPWISDEEMQRFERLQVQLAGCLCVAEGGPPCGPDAYGWSVALEQVAKLRKVVDPAYLARYPESDNPIRPGSEPNPPGSPEFADLAAKLGLTNA